MARGPGADSRSPSPRPSPTPYRGLGRGLGDGGVGLRPSLIPKTYTEASLCRTAGPPRNNFWKLASARASLPPRWPWWGLRGKLRWEGAAGGLSRDPEAAAVTLDTVFDLASLTKPLATALALMVLADRGKLDSSHPPGRDSPGRMAAAGQASPDPEKPPHPPGRAAGLAAFLSRRCWRPRPRPALPCLERLAAATPLAYPPDTATLYSDLGFMLLKAVVEELSGENLDQFCREVNLPAPGTGHPGLQPPAASPGGERTALMPPPSRASSRDAPARAKCTTKTPGPRAGWRATPASSAPAGRFFIWWPAFSGLMAESRSGRSPRPRSGSF